MNETDDRPKLDTDGLVPNRTTAELSGIADENSVLLRLTTLAETFNLSNLERDILSILLEIYQGEATVNPEEPTVSNYITYASIVEFFTAQGVDVTLVKQAFALESPLRRWSLVYANSETPWPYHTRNTSLINIDGRIAEYLLGEDAPDPELMPLLSSFGPEGDVAGINLLTEEQTAFVTSAAATAVLGEAQTFLLSGDSRMVKRQAAELYCRLRNQNLMLVDVRALLVQKERYLFLFRKIMREAFLNQASLFLDNFGDLNEDKPEHIVSHAGLLKILSEEGQTSFLCINDEVHLEKLDYKSPVQPIHFPSLATLLRRQIWTAGLQRLGFAFAESLAAEFSKRFEMTPEQINSALSLAAKRQVAVLDKRWKLENALLDCCRVQKKIMLSEAAVSINSRLGFDDLILPEEQTQRLQEVVNTFRYARSVYRGWNFQSKYDYGLGLTALLSGPPGVGKTMAVGILAREMGLEAYRVDISSLVSKYIGETEKNLAGLFNEARSSGTLLFFDEADSIFGKRGEVNDSRDRHANMETSFLLQKVEEHPGVVILATNLLENIDDAFIRRMKFIIDFPMPDEPSRLRIWQSGIPDETPRGELDLNFLAHKIKMSGASIKNIILSAAFLARAEDEIISMRYLMIAAKNEYRKVGKNMLPADFSPYYQLIEGGK